MAKRTRAKAKAKPGQAKYKKVGGGTFNYGGKLIKSGETFYADPKDISPAFKDIIVRVKEPKKDE